MSLHLSDTTFLTLCALLRDAMLVQSDATPMLAQAARELERLPAHTLPASLRQDTKKLATLQQAGFAKGSVSQVAPRPIACP